MSDLFHFQQFTIRHDQCAMKVGTDAVLLGAWSRWDPSVESPVVLDVGTGSGVIALILAQRCRGAVIRGIELDPAAGEQCAGNFRESPWPERLAVVQASFQDFARSQQELQPSANNGIDLLVCNPPFFPADRHLHAAGEHRRMARQDHHLPLMDLVRLGGPLLSESGNISMVLPFDSRGDLKEIAALHRMAIRRETLVRPLADKAPNRLLVELRKGAAGYHQPEVSELVLLRSRLRNDFTSEFREMVGDLYLKKSLRKH